MRDNPVKEALADGRQAFGCMAYGIDQALLQQALERGLGVLRSAKAPSRR